MRSRVDAYQENENQRRKLDINQGCESTPNLNFVALEFLLANTLNTTTHGDWKNAKVRY
jgi:hypothetical protein